MNDLLKTWAAGGIGVGSQMLGSVDHAVAGLSAFLTLGVPAAVFVYTCSKLYFLWKNKGE